VRVPYDVRTGAIDERIPTAAALIREWARIANTCYDESGDDPPRKVVKGLRKPSH